MRMLSRSRLSIAAHTAILLALAGCAATKQSRFQMPFAPPAPAAASTVRLASDPPSLPPNPFLSSETPAFNVIQSRLTPIPTPSDLLISRADDAFRKGKRLYQSGDKEKARTQ